MLKELQYNKIFEVIWKLKYIIEFILSLIVCSSIFNIIYFKKYYDIWNLKNLIITVIAGTIMLVIIIKNIKDNKEKIENIFVTIAIPIAISYAIFMMILYVPDEHSHMSRAFNIARGKIFVSFDEHDESIPKTLQDIQSVSTYKKLVEANEKDIYLQGDEIKFFNTFVMYFPSVYIGPVIGNQIANLLNMNIINTMYLMRIINIIVYVVFGYFTIKWIPFGKLLTMTYLCIPMLVHEAASVAADCFINSACLLFIAYNMKLLFKNESYTLKEKITYFVLALLATLNKTAYLPLVFLGILLMFKKDKIVKKKDRIFMIVTIIMMIAITGIWYIYGTHYDDTRAYIIENNISSSEQLNFIKTEPVKFTKAILNTFIENTSMYLYQALGQHLARLTVHVDIIIPTIYLILLIFAAFLEKSNYRLNGLQKTFIILLTIGMYALVLFAQYLGWTKIGENIVDGVQGRYLLPFLILPLLCIIPKNKYLDFKNTVPVYSILIVLLNILSLVEIVSAFI